jgi:hypothetical protein
VRKPDVVGGEVTSVRLESRMVVGRQHPIGTWRSRLEVPTTPKAVALGHLATHGDDLAIPGELPEDSANSQASSLSTGVFSESSPGTWCRSSVLSSSVRVLVAQTAMRSVTSSSSVLGGSVFSDRVS